MTKSKLAADRSAGLGVDARMLLVFFAATLLMVAAVAVVGLVVRWWVLVPVMLADFAVTFGVIAVILRQLANESDTPG